MDSTSVPDYPVSLRFPTTGSVMPIYRQLCLGSLSQLLTHEFNNSLTSLSGYAQMALSIRREDIMLKAAQIFQDVSNRLQELIHHIHTLARESLEEIRPCDPTQAALLVQKILDHHLQKRNIQLQLGGAIAHSVPGNTVVLALGILTFVLDARDRLLEEGKGGEIRIHFADDPGAVIMVLEDTASRPCQLVGPAAVEIPAVDPAADPLRSLAPLALHAVADIHRGTITAQPTPASFRLTMRLPLSPDPASSNP